LQWKVAPKQACLLHRKKPRIIVGGFLGLLPAGGVAWDYVQYPVGFSMLGCDVYYIEDTCLWPVYQVGNDGGSDCSSNVAYLSRLMAAFGLGDRWAYLDAASGQCFGLAANEVEELLRTADVLVNVSCSTFLREEYHRIPIRILVDSDPMFTQVKYCNGSQGMREMVDAHTHHFTFGENIGASDCAIPQLGLKWRPTRQPVCLSHWPVKPLPSEESAFTTVMNWTATAPLVFAGQAWGQKDVEFLRLLDLPRRVPSITLAAAVGQTTGSSFPADQAREYGWQVMDPQVCAGDWIGYQKFIESSTGEFSVAKETYIKARTGWFSCRSACYLAAGRPVVTQETGWSAHIPPGEGLFAYQDAEGAAAAIRAVSRDPERHGRKARELAEEFFSSDRVLARMLDEAGA
jgi:hypothetical protein